MDWDGIGTFALFLSSGAVGVGIIMLRAYKARLAARLEWLRIEQRGGDGDDAEAQVRELEEQVRRLSERVDFTERLLERGRTPLPSEGLSTPSGADAPRQVDAES